MILLDTHAVIWLLIAPERLSRRAREAILKSQVSGERIACSLVSLYGIVNSVRRNRLQLHCAVNEFIAAVQSKIELAPLTPEIAICAGELAEPFHGDPMDRVIAATAIIEDCVLITADKKIRDAKVCKAMW